MTINNRFITRLKCDPHHQNLFQWQKIIIVLLSVIKSDYQVLYTCAKNNIKRFIL
jgi:hypothetical protein